MLGKFFPLLLAWFSFPIFPRKLDPSPPPILISNHLLIRLFGLIPIIFGMSYIYINTYCILSMKKNLILITCLLHFQTGTTTSRWKPEITVNPSDLPQPSSTSYSQSFPQRSASPALPPRHRNHPHPRRRLSIRPFRYSNGSHRRVRSSPKRQDSIPRRPQVLALDHSNKSCCLKAAMAELGVCSAGPCTTCKWWKIRRRWLRSLR